MAHTCICYVLILLGTAPFPHITSKLNANHNEVEKKIVKFSSFGLTRNYPRVVKDTPGYWMWSGKWLKIDKSNKIEIPIQIFKKIIAWLDIPIP